MNRFKRPMAWVLSALLLLGQTGIVAHADDDLSVIGIEEKQQYATPSEPDSNKPANGDPVIDEPVHDGSINDLPDSDEPDDDGQRPFIPVGEAWTVFRDGTSICGTLQQILSKLNAGDEEATVYIMEKKAHRITDVSVSVFQRTALLPDPDRIENADSYEAYVEQITEDGVEVFVVSLLTKEEIEERETALAPNEPAGDQADSKGRPEESGSGSPEDSTPGAGLDGKTDEDPVKPDDGQDADLEGPDDGNGDDNDLAASMSIHIDASGIQSGEWQNTAPTFSFTGIPEGCEDQYVYGVFICEDRLVLLKNGATQYVPNLDGNLSFRFAILDLMGDVVALSQQYDVMLDMTPPEILIEQDPEDRTSAIMTANDLTSGVCGISFDGGQTWEAFENGGSLTLSAYDDDGVIEEGAILVRDLVGNVAVSARFEFDWEDEWGYGEDFEGMIGGLVFGGSGSGRSGSGGKKIVHVKETMDYSRVNYNALELVFPEEPAAELVAGGTVLPLSMAAQIDGETTDGLFSAKLLTWRTDEDDARETPNALVLTAASESETNTWSFSGETYRLLYNSGVEYLVFASGEYMTAVPTEGFTGGTAYAKLKAGGISTRKFLYTLAQDEALRETMLSVEVEGEMYLLGEERDQPMYRYDVLIGTLDMMQEPFASFLPENQASADVEGGSGNEV